MSEAKLTRLRTLLVGVSVKLPTETGQSRAALAQSDPELTKRELLAQVQRRGDVNKDRRDIVNSLVPEQLYKSPLPNYT